jgi:hypothetical protein
MFSYCVAHLGMSEDEACRRIELARLARKFPALFAELASGQISLSVALVLKPVLSQSNLFELLSAARGRSIRQARELVAERFPKPDAPSSIRKLPEPRSAQASPPLEACAPVPLAACLPFPLLATATVASPAKATQLAPASPTLPAVTSPSLAQACAPSSPLGAAPVASTSVLPPPEVERQAASPAARTDSLRPVSHNSIEPLSAGRYRIQFTADAALKQQLERARDLLRHAHPTGDFAPIVAGALQLLLDDLLRRRFGAGARRKVATAPANIATAPANVATAPANVATALARAARRRRKSDDSGGRYRAPCHSARAARHQPAVARHCLGPETPRNVGQRR